MEKHIKCLIQACHNQGIAYEAMDKEQNVIRVKINDTWQYFQSARTPFNDQAMAGLCLDKDHTYQILKNTVNMPKTVSFLDFNTDEKYQHYVKFKNITAIITEIENTFTYPVVIKKNKGGLGANVFLCHNRDEAMNAITVIFDRDSKHYDYVVLAQAFIPTVKEYRAVFYNRQLVLIYERMSGDSTTGFNCRYWETNKGFAKPVHDTVLKQRISDFVQPIFDTIGINYVGFDLIIDENDECHFIEMNSAPRYDHFIDHNGETGVIQLFETILTQ